MDDQVSEIREALECAVTFVLKSAKKRGYGTRFPKEQFLVAYWKPREGTANSSLVTEKRTRESFPGLSFESHASLRASKPFRSLDELSRAFVANHGVEMGKYWHSDYGERMVLRYFDKAGSFKHDRDVLESVVDEFRNDVTSKKELLRLVYHVEGLIGLAPFSLCDGIVSFRPVADRDLDEYARLRPGLTPLPQDIWLTMSGWICECRITGRKRDHRDFNNARNLVDDVLNTLYLAKEGSATFVLLAHEIANTFLKSGRISGGEPLRVGRAGPIEIAASDIGGLDDTMRRITRISKSKGLILLQLPLRRIRTAASRRNPADAFVDVVVALESLLANDSTALEVTHRFRLRGAAILNDDFGSARERMELLNRIYKKRSDIVHGKYDPDSSEMASLLGQAHQVLKATLRWYLSHLDVLNPTNVVRTLDEWMVQGGSTKAHSSDPPR